MVIGTTRHCHFCGQVHFMGDARGPQWCEDDVALTLGVLGPQNPSDSLDGFSNLEGKPVPLPAVGIDELFTGKKPSRKRRAT